jgi:type VI secretion system secreted protein Hcp
MAAVDYFLKLDGISGDSTDAQHKDEIEVLSFSWGVTQTGIVDGGGGGGAGKANLQDFHFVAGFGKASPQLMLSCATGKHIREAVLIGRGARGVADEFIKVRLSDILVTSYQAGGSDDAVPTDQFSMNFAKIEYAGSSFDVIKNE